MKLEVDENLPIEVVDLLRQRGHDSVSVAEQQLAGRPDGDVASKCQVEQRAIVTLDLDFADIRSYPPEDYAASSCRVPSSRTSRRSCV